MSTDERGNKTKQEVSFTEEQLLDIEELVKRTIGYNEARGDSVTVYNIPFFIGNESPVASIPIWEKPFVWDIAKKLLGGLLVLIIFFKVIKPIIFSLPTKQNAAKARGNTVEEAANHITEDEAMKSRIPVIEQKMEKLEYMTANNTELPPAHVYGDILNMAKELAKQDPKRVAKVVKDWVGDDG